MKYSEERRRNISKGVKTFYLNHVSHSKGKKLKPLSEEHKLKLSLAHKGKISPNKGKILSDNWRKNIRNAQLKKYANIPKVTPQILLERKNALYDKWRNSVLQRDKVCIICSNNQQLEAHHLLSFSRFPDFRYEIWNGLTLCTKCHDKEDKKRREDDEEISKMFCNIAASFVNRKLQDLARKAKNRDDSQS